jgi:predicted small secreted protein
MNRTMNRTKITLVRLAMLVAVLLVGGCNTVSGLGEDIGAAGAVIKDTANKTKEKIQN